jgi:hypothetical protein
MARMRSSVPGISFTRPCCWSDSSAAETWPVASIRRRISAPGLSGGRSRRAWPCAFRPPATARRGGPLRRPDAGGVADQEHAVVGAEPRKELAHLVGAGKARFIDKVEVPSAPVVAGLGERARNPCRVPDSTPASFKLAGGAGGRGEALDRVALRFGGAADRRKAWSFCPRRRNPGFPECGRAN